MIFLGVVLLAAAVGVNAQTHIQGIISDDLVTPDQFFANDVASYGDWIAAGSAKARVTFMKWNGTHYDDTNRQVVTGSGWFGTRVTMRGDWTFVSGVNTQTSVYKINAGNTAWAHEVTIPYGREISRYPDSYNGQYRAVDTTDDGSKIAIIDDTTSSYRIYEYTSSWAQVGSQISVGFTPLTVSFTGDGSRVIPCSDTECKVFDAASGTELAHINKAYLGAPFDSATPGVGTSVATNTDGSVIVVAQNTATSNGYVHFLHETSTNTWTVAQTLTDNTDTEGWGSGTFDYLGNDIQYSVEYDLWMVNDGLHSTRSDGNRYRQGAVYMYRLNPANSQYNLEYSIFPWDMVPTGNFHDDNFGQGGMAFTSGKLILGTKAYDEPSIGTGGGDGRVDIITVPLTAYPTPSPTLAPTNAPTPNPRVNVGTVKVNMAFTNNTKSNAAANDIITDTKEKYADVDIVVKGTDTMTMSYDQIQNTGATDQELLDAIKASRNCSTTCTAVIVGGRRRMSSSRELDTQVEIVLTFELDDEAFAALGSNTLDSPGFLASLASDLGVDVSELSVSVTGSEVSVEISLIAISSEGQPLEEDTLDLLQQLATDTSAVSTAIVNEIGGGTVVTEDVDLCGTRTCSGRGDYIPGTTTVNGCIIATGVCECVGEWWGLNCEQACTCLNSGVCKGAYCMCDYPYYGFRCGSNVTQNCVDLCV